MPLYKNIYAHKSYITLTQISEQIKFLPTMNLSAEGKNASFAINKIYGLIWNNTYHPNLSMLFGDTKN